MSRVGNVDRRQVPGPEKSVPPIHLKESKEKIKQAIVNNQRIDKRSNTQQRPVYIQTNHVSKASGSAYIEQGKIRVTCAVYGPRPIKKQGAVISSTHGNLECEFKFSNFATSWRTVNQRSNTEEKEISFIIKQAIGPSICYEMFPKSTVDVFVTVLESDGRLATISAAILCASIALVDADIDMYDIVSCSSLGLFDNTWVTDCTQDEENEQNCAMLVSSMCSVKEVTHVLQLGKTVDIEQTQKGIDQCLDSCSELYITAANYLANLPLNPIAE